MSFFVYIYVRAFVYSQPSQQTLSGAAVVCSYFEYYEQILIVSKCLKNYITFIGIILKERLLVYK